MIPFPDKKYQIIYADPPWQYKTKECLAKKSILNGKLNKHYNTMELEDLKNLDVQNITAKNALLFLWIVSPMLVEGIQVMSSWGFKYATVVFVWYKQNTNPGHYTMSECEFCLIGKTGRIPYPRGARNIRQMVSRRREKHSQKPEEVRNRINKMFPTQNKIELFARERVEGWDAWGDEVDGKKIIKTKLKIREQYKLI
ncbi:MAG: MT-A70 family methyltransferase [Candidatus Heimdallarchaeaceae archaeon]